MLTRLLAAALFAGLTAGLLVAGLQSYFVTPMILKAETFEGQAAPHEHAAGEAAHTHDHGDASGGHTHGADEWKPADGAERLIYTAVATVATAVGYALVLLSIMTIAGAPLTTDSLVKWALGGFIATTLAPGFGLAPLLPGMGEAALEPRQIWWIATALATGAGLYIATHFTRNPLALAGGIALIVIPHIWGAPAGDVQATAVPGALAARFAASTMTLSFVLWTGIALALGLAFSHLGRDTSNTQTA